MREIDYTKLSKATWDSEVLYLLAQLHECRVRQEVWLEQKGTTLERLVEITKKHSARASNVIEAAVSNGTHSKNSEETIPPDPSKNEINSYCDALDAIDESYEHVHLTADYILQLHNTLYSGLGIGGRFKNEQYYISVDRKDGTTYMLDSMAPNAAGDIVEAICRSYNKAILYGVVDPLLLIPIFVSDFVAVAPFKVGNGKMSCLLTNLLLYRSGYMVGRYVSLETIIVQNIDFYSDAHLLASYRWHEGENDSLPFIKYILGAILAAYHNFEDWERLVDEKLPAAELVRRAVQKRRGKFTKGEIMEQCPIIKKASVENALKKLVESGEITRHGIGKKTFYTR